MLRARCEGVGAVPCVDWHGRCDARLVCESVSVSVAIEPSGPRPVAQAEDAHLDVEDPVLALCLERCGCTSCRVVRHTLLDAAALSLRADRHDDDVEEEQAAAAVPVCELVAVVLAKLFVAHRLCCVPFADGGCAERC